MTIVRKRVVVQCVLPWSEVGSPREGLSRTMKKFIGKHDRELDGIVLDVDNVQAVDWKSPIDPNTGELRLDVIADFVIFRADKGDELTGVVQFKCNTHLSVLVHQMFNVAVLRSPDWLGDGVELGETVSLTVDVAELREALPNIQGTLKKVSLPQEEPPPWRNSAALRNTVVFEGTKPMVPVSNSTNGTDIIDTFNNEHSDADKNSVPKNVSKKVKKRT